MTDRPLETQKRLFNNTALLSAAEVIGQLVNFAFIVCLARVFGRELLGVYAFAMAIGALLSVLVSFGTHALVLRTLSREPDRTAEATGALLGYQAGVSLLLVLAVHLTALWLGAKPLMLWVVTLVVSFHVFMCLTHLLVLGYSARQEMGPAAMVQTAPRIVILLLGGLAMLWGASAVLTLASMPVAALLILGATILFCSRRFGRPHLRLQRAEIGHYLRKGLPFFYVVVLTTLYMRLGIIYLTVLGGEDEAGLFASAERVVVAAGVVQIMFSTALFPVVSRLWEHQRERFAEFVQRATRLILFLTLPLATLLALFAEDIVRLLYGDAFNDAAGVLTVVAWVLVVRGIAQLLFTTTMAADHQQVLVTSKILGLVMLTLASLALIPSYGAMGLVAAMLISELSATTLNYWLLQRAGVPVMAFSSGLRVALACLLAAGLALLVSDLALWLRLLVVASGGATALWGFGAVRSYDLAYLRTILATPQAR